jgi:hypothetical protein
MNTGLAGARRGFALHSVVFKIAASSNSVS